MHDAEAVRLGIVDRLVPEGEDVAAAARALAVGLARSSAPAVRSIIACVDAAAGDPAEGMRFEGEEVVRMLTDGGENASTIYEQAAVLAQLDEHHVFVIALGALLADVPFMRELTRGRGVFVYTREFSALQRTVMPYLESLKELIEVRIAELDPPPSEVRVELDGMELMLTAPAP